MQIYKVGGAVRDKLMQKKCSDNDYVVVGASVEEMLSLGFEKVGKSFPVFLHPKTKEEYALARKDIKTGSSHKDFKFVFDKSITLKEDSIRRDFTCNAIYEDIKTGKLIDYHNGIEDIKNKTLRHISKHFTEDPLRVLRACRLSATLDFDIAPETLDLCKQMVEEGAISHLSKSRIFQELEKALLSPQFYRFIENARKIGLLKELFPEVDNLWNVPERIDYHPEKNTGEHTLLALKNSQSSDAVVNLAILLHDVGKAMTDQRYWPSHHNHEKLGVELAKNILKRINAPNKYREFILFVIENHMLYHRPLKDIKRELVKVALIITANKNNNYYERFIAVLRADMMGRALNNFDKEEKEFDNFCQTLKDLVIIASHPKSEYIPNFMDYIQKIQNKEITKTELEEIEISSILDKKENLKTLGVKFN